MKNKEELTQINIDNLISIWITAGKRFGAHNKTPNFDYCLIENSQWPNKLWTNKSLNTETIGFIKQQLTTMPSLQVWNIYNKPDDDIFKSNGFRVKSEQTAMNLKLSETFETEDNLEIILVTNSSQSKLWSNIFTSSFGYSISADTVSKTNKNINYYIAYSNNKAIGTVLLHKTGNTIGVHSLGIAPENRRQGFANRIMKLTINKAINEGYRDMTLQASDKGLGLYLKLGFKKLFLIKNYIL
ncbi:MAG: GNAT family N-acetyltransferase [Flavobacteriaceae bacterium]|nr:GNAT family N-acetyltransferase [Flavobacteriaceae bacterium]